MATRNLGPTLEVDPVIGPDNVTIDVNLIPEITRLAATVPVGDPRLGLDLPVFHTIRTSTAVTAHSGTAVLLGMHTPTPKDPASPPLGSDQRILSIVSARIVKPN